MQRQPNSEQVISDLLTMVKTQALGMWRFRWVSLIAAWAVCIVGWFSVYMMPDLYSAHARVYVDTENAIDDFLGGIAAPSDVISDVTIVVREIVSRPNLAEVARNTDLALRASTDEEFEDLLTSLQERIEVAGNRDGVYSIEFQDTSRDKALAVVESLLTAFVEESLGADRSDSEQAQQFLEDQIREYEQRLTEAEDRLAEFKRENVDMMPDQRGDYFSRLQAAEAALELTQGQLSLAVERRAELERQIAGEEPVFGIMSQDPVGDVSSYSARIRELELQVEELRLRYTDRHPRIVQILDTIELLREQEAEELSQLEAAGGAPGPQSNPLDLNPVYQNMRIQLSNVEVEIASLRAQQNQQLAETTRLQTMVDTIPQVEAELNRLNRDYDVVRANHQQLLQQLETANIGEDASRSIDEIQFRVIEPPFSDTSPVGPNRPLFLAIVLVFALGIAGAIAFLLNMLRPTFIGNRSVTDVLGIPVLAAVSMLQTHVERQKERRSRHALQAAVVILVVTFALATVYSEQGSDIVRGLAASVS